MKKLMNSPYNFVSESLEGFLLCHSSSFEKIPDVCGIKKINLQDKPAVVIGGGSGHEPMFAYFLGNNLADAAAVGNIFASPDPDTILKTALSVNRDKGILFVYGNYSGDNMNFDMACELLDDMKIPCRTVRVWDDIASAPKDRITDRRGIAGDVFVIKTAGAASMSHTLEETYRITSKARDHTFSIGVGLSGGTIPGEESPTFSLCSDEIEFGLGIHGEPGIRREKLLSADETTDILLDLLIKESELKAGDTICTLVNGLGSTSLAELYIMNRRLYHRLKDKNISIHDMDVNSYVTCQEMSGASITIFKLDDELKKYYDVPCFSPYYNKYLYNKL